MNDLTARSTESLAPRLDMYAAIHKALRLFMSDTLIAVGRMDPEDREEREATLAQVRELLAFCTQHLHHENEFVHPAIEARNPGHSGQIAAEHVEHVREIEALRDAVTAVERASGPARFGEAQRLYNQLAVFVAENFVHMNYEQTAHNAALWASYTDAELNAIHDELLASIPPAEMALTLRWMLPALSHIERVGMLSAMKQGAPPEVFAGVLALARAHLRERDFAKLSEALGLTARAAA